MTLSNEELKEQVKELWQTCFNDSEAFIDLFFNRKYVNDRVMFIERNGKIYSALQCIPYLLELGGEKLLASYLAGVSTLPEYRGKGFAATLIDGSARKLYHAGVAFALVIPASRTLFDYYAARGYATCFYRHIYPEQPLETKSIIEAIGSSDNPNDLYGYYNSAMRQQRPCAVRHSKDDFQTILDSLQLDGGDMYIAIANNSIEAVAFVEKEEATRTQHIKECIGDPEMAERMRHDLSEWYNQEGYKTISYRSVPSDHPQAQPYGMARILNVEKVLQRVAAENPRRIFSISVDGDTLIPENNGTYTLAGGLCLRGDVKGEKKRYTIPQLTREILTERGASMSLMLD